jgi:hypothetical protein
LCLRDLPSAAVATAIAAVGATIAATIAAKNLIILKKKAWGVGCLG